jgi:hypothetical protein
MVNCEKCEKAFKTNWHLQRHLSKKVPCNTSPQFTTIPPQFTTIPPQFTTISPQFNTIPPQFTTILRCEYCSLTFNRIDNLNRHVAVCGQRNDNVRLLEIKLGLKIVIDISSTICRFCDASTARKDSLNRHYKICKKRSDYEIHLKSLLKQKCNYTTTIENFNTVNTVNVINHNTYVVNSLGSENTSYVTCEVIKKLLKDCSSNDEFMAKTLAYIHAHEEHPENHNIIYSNLRSNTALVKYDNKFEYKNIDDVLKRATSNLLDHIVFSHEYDTLSNVIKKKFEEVCEDDEMNRYANSMTKIELYNCQKNGKIKNLLNK